MVTTRKSANIESPARKPPKVPASARKPPRGGKKKVGSPQEPAVAAGSVEYSSDEFAYSDHEDVSATDEQEEAAHIPGNYTSDSSHASTTSRTRTRLAPEIVVSLLSDIQKAGGIQAFRLRANQALNLLLNKRPDIYGERGEPLRRKIQLKVYKWSQCSESEWGAILLQHNITEKASYIKGAAPHTQLTSAGTSKRLKISSPAPAKPKQAEDSDSDSDRSVEEKKPKAKVDCIPVRAPAVEAKATMSSQSKPLQTSFPPNTRK